MIFQLFPNCIYYLISLYLSKQALLYKENEKPKHSCHNISIQIFVWLSFEIFFGTNLFSLSLFLFSTHSNNKTSCKNRNKIHKHTEFVPRRSTKRKIMIIINRNFKSSWAFNCHSLKKNSPKGLYVLDEFFFLKIQFYSIIFCPEYLLIDKNKSMGLPQSFENCPWRHSLVRDYQIRFVHFIKILD